MMRMLRGIVAGGLCAALLAGAPGTGEAADKVRLLVSTRGPFEMFAPNQAQAEGFFKDENLDVEFTYAQGGAETTQAIATGGADVSVGVGILSVIAAYGKGAPIRIISNGKRGAGEIFWYVNKDSPIKSFKDLDGKVLAYSRPGSTTHLIVQTLVKELKIKPRLVSVGDMASSRTQVMSGQVDTAWASYPFNYDLINKGEARVIGTGADATELETFSMRVQAANAAFLKQKRDVAVRFMRAYQRALEWQYKNPEPAIKRWVETFKLDPEAAKQVPKFTRYETVTLAPIGNLEGNVRLAVEYKMLSQPLTEAQMKELVDIVHDPRK